MKIKLISAFAVVLVFVISCCFSVSAAVIPTLADTIDNIKSIDSSKYVQYSSDEWNSLSSDERSSIINSVISDQNGKGYITPEYCNDSSNSFSTYIDLISDGFDSAVDSSANFFRRISLELFGQADFGMGYYGKDGHSSGKFGEGTVADTLNDDFIDYYKKNPYTSDKMYIFPDTGYYIISELVLTSYSVEYNFNLYNSDDVWLYTLAGQGEMNPPNDDNVNYYSKYVSFKDFSITDPSTGAYTVTRHWYHVDFDCYFDTVHTGVCNYLANNSDSDFTDSVSLDTVIHNDNGDFLNVKLTSDGVTYEGNTYNYNDDNSVTINGDKYYITINPSDVDEDYYKQFLGDTINNYYNYYTTEGKEFDDTDIISSLKSIFTSLETFRSYFYSEIKQFYDSVRDGFNGLSRSLSNLGKKLDEIIKQLKTINKQLDDISEEQQEDNKLKWLDLIGKFQNKIGWSNLLYSMGNISTGFFGSRTFTVNENGGIDVSISSRDDSTVVPSSMPSLSVEYMGVKYDLYTCLGSLAGIGTIKEFISLFLWAGFLVSLFRSIPSIIGGVASVQDHSNNVVIDRNTGEVKRGA